MKKKLYTIALFFICSCICMEQVEKKPTMRWQEIEEGTFIGQLPLELRQELGKFLYHKINEDIDRWFDQWNRMGGLKRLNRTTIYNMINRFYSFFEKIQSIDQAYYIFEKISDRFNVIFANDTNAYTYFLINVPFYWFTLFIKYTSRKKWYPLFEKALQDNRLFYFVDLILDTNVLTIEEILDISTNMPNIADRSKKRLQEIIDYKRK